MENDHFKPAFPTMEANHLKDYSDPGMTLRDYFAAKAMTVAWAALEGGYFEADAESSAERMAECAYQLADAMLRAREAS